MAVVLGGLLLTSSPILGSSIHTIWQLLLSAIIGAALIKAAKWPPLSKLLSVGPLVSLGRISFGLYVYHRFCIDAFVKLCRAYGVDGNNEALWFLCGLACLSATVGVSLEFHTLRLNHTIYA